VTYNGQEVSRHRFERLAIREARWFVRAAARFD
jgi:hypothetical protein